MSFHYQKNKDHNNNESFWTSYSDLFLGLSSIFLLLYVTASLRSGTDGLQQQIENKKLSMQLQDLQNQLKMYESVKQDYLKNEASKDEQQEYMELMDKLTLLQSEAHNEKSRLEQAALENAQKEKALNKYQQMVRNIINANKMAKTKINQRENVIEEQDQNLADLEAEVSQKEKLIADNEAKISKAEQQLKNKMAELKRSLNQNKITAKAYQNRLKKAQQEAQQQIDSLQNQKQQYESQLADTQKELGQIAGKLQSTQMALSSTAGALNTATEQLKDTQGRLKNTQGQLKDTEGQLAKAKAEMDTRRQIAQEIKKGFEKAGIKADINMKTGEVLLDFGKAYFDNDSAKLKKEMKSVLEKAMPVYSRSLFGNPKVAQKISTVEIVGFASPTYKGKFVDPQSNRPEDKEAIKYNMDLSYRRAKSIFNHILDDKSIRFEHQDDLLPMLKVSGRSFLEVLQVNRNVASEDFCKVNDCKKAQRVIIRFSMDGKNKGESP